MSNETYIFDGEQPIFIYHIRDLNNGYFIGYGKLEYLFDKDKKILEKANSIRQSGDFIAINIDDQLILRNNKMEVIGKFPDKIIYFDGYVNFHKHHIVLAMGVTFVYDSNFQLKLKSKTEVLYTSYSTEVFLSNNEQITLLLNKNLKPKSKKH